MMATSADISRLSQLIRLCTCHVTVLVLPQTCKLV